jgi:hypothetical protein
MELLVRDRRKGGMVALFREAMGSRSLNREGDGSRRYYEASSSQ